MADYQNKLNNVAGAYQKRMKDPNWKVGVQKDTDAFSKGASESGSLIDPAIKDKISKAWGRLVK